MTEHLGHVGDGVYLSFYNGAYWLAVNHHENRVVALEENVWLHLKDMIAKHNFGRSE